MLQSGLPSGEERRGLPFDDAGIDIRDSGDSQRFHGYAAVFNVRTAIGNPLKWGFYEEIAAGCFSKTLSEGDARMLIDHDTYYIVSRVSAGTLLLAQDERGLLTDSALNTDLSYVADLRTNVRVRNITGMSFGFQVTKDDWDTEKVSTSDGNQAEVEVRVIREVKLYEVSAVTFPAYEETTAGLRHSLVPALVRRGDRDAIVRAALAKPELAPLLGYDPDLAPKRFFLNDDKALGPLEGSGLVREPPRGLEELPGEMLGYDAPIQATGDVMEPEEVREPAETTRTEDDQQGQTTGAEPAASTRSFESQSYDAKARTRAVELFLRLAS